MPNFTTLLSLPSNKLRPMTESDTKLIISIIIHEETKTPVPGPLKESFPFKVMEARLKNFSPSLKVADWVLAFFAAISENPAQVVMYAWMLHNWGLQDGFKTNISMEVLAQHIIPEGLPTEETLHELWEAQKVRPAGSSDNALDYPATWVLNPDVQKTSDAEEG